MPFRAAYKLTGQIVAYCIEKGLDLESVDLETYRSFSELFCEDLYEAIALSTCVNKRISLGGTGKESIQRQIKYYQKQAQ